MTHADRPIRAVLSALALTLVALTAVLAAAVQAQTTTATPATSAKPATPAKAAIRSGAPVLLNFPNTDIEAVTRAMAAMIGRQILVDPRVKGTITLYSEQPMSVRDAYLNYQSALRGLGFAVVESGGLLKVVPEAEAKLQTGVEIGRAHV